MFALSNSNRFHLYSQPTDMRKSFDGLSGLIQNNLGDNPCCGDVFIFLNKRWDKIKLLHWQGISFILYYKRLEEGTYEMPVYDKQVGSITQYTSEEYLRRLKNHKIKISMDGRGRALDNVYIERFWRSIKQEKIYLNPPNGGLELFNMAKDYIQFYNEKRRHTEIGKMPPYQKYYEKKLAS